MTLKISPAFLRGDQRCVRARAVINKSKRRGIPRRYQKTFSMKTVAPEFTAVELENSIRAEAARWEKKIMDKIKGVLPEPQPKEVALL